MDGQCLKIITETITQSPAFQNVRYWSVAWMQTVETRSLWTVNNMLKLAALRITLGFVINVDDKEMNGSWILSFFKR